MSIKEIIDTNPNIQLVISAADLKEFALELLAEREKASTQPEKYLTIAETAENTASVNRPCGVGQKLNTSLK